MENTTPLGSFVPELPATDGQWSGTRGDSDWLFDLGATKWDIYDSNPLQIPHPTRTWGEIIGDCYYPNADRVTFQNSFPDFDPYVVAVTDSTGQSLDGVYQTPAGETISGDRSTNFRAADRWVAEQIDCSVCQVQDLRSQERLTWHEKEDTRTIILVPRAIHGFVHHSGGIEEVNRGGIGGGREDIPWSQQRILNGEELYRVRNLDLWRRVKKAGDYTAGDAITLSYVCLDPAAGPTPAQQAKAQELLSSWPALFGRAQELLAEYVQAEWLPDGGDWQARATELIIYQEVLWEQMTAGILCDFSLDPEHGLGVRILGDGSMLTGPGDIAL